MIQPTIHLTIRPIVAEDAAAVIELAVATGLFPETETDLLAKLLADYFGGKTEEGHACVIASLDEPIGVAYYSPAPATDRAWYLTMIAVRPDHQNRGYGTALLEYVETALRTDNQRLLLIETSGLPAYERTRAFYTKSGYTEAARIADFWTEGDDLLVFRKALNAS